MEFGDTQLVGDLGSPSRSSLSGDSTGYDSPMHEPKQLLYTQLFGPYGARMDRNAHKRQHHPDLDLETQLIDDHSFDDFRKNEGLIMPSEDEASKETQLIHGGDEGHSGSSSGKDGEVDSALSTFDTGAFSQKQSQWLSEFTRRDRGIEAVTGRASHGNFPFRVRYTGETQILSDDGNVLDTLNNHSGRNFADVRAGGASAGPPNSQNRDVDLPHFLRDFDPNRQDYTGQGTVGTWQEVTGQSEDRGWESAVRGLQLVDSDASTEGDGRNRNNSVFSTDISFPGEGQMSQNVNPRTATRVSRLFCMQDLNKSPEPEYMMDGWEEENRADLGIGGIDEGGSNVDLLQVVKQGVLQSSPMEMKISEGLSERTTRAPPSTGARTVGSIRAVSLRASALQASSCSSSGRYHHSPPQGSKSEEVQKFQRDVTTIKMPRNNLPQKEVQNVQRDATPIEMPRNNVPQKAAGSSGDTTAMSRITIERGHSAASFPSLLSYRNSDTDSCRIDKALEAVKATTSVDAEVRALSKVGMSMQGEASSLFGVEVSKPAAERSSNGGRKLNVWDDGNELEKSVPTTVDDGAEAQSQPSSKRVDHGKENEAEPMPPREDDSSPSKRVQEIPLERRSSFGSGLFSTGSDMSYLSTQSPGEDSQARALNMVDKLVWLNNIGLPQELRLEEEKAPPKSGRSATVKSVLQSRVQVAEAKAGMDDPFGVFDWVDSQDPFRGGTANASASEGPSKALVDGGGQSNKQNRIGSKKRGVVDVPGSRNKRAEKLHEKAKFVKPTPITDKHKGLVPKNIPQGIEPNREQHLQEGSSVAMDIRQEHGGTEPEALDFADSRQHRVGGGAMDKQSGLSDKELNRFGVMDNSSPPDKLQLLSTPKLPPPHQQGSKPVAEQGRSSNDVSLEYSKEASEVSKDSPKAPDVHTETDERTGAKKVGEPESSQQNDDRPAAQSRSTVDLTAFSDAQASVVGEASVGKDCCVLDKTSAPDRMEGGLMQQDFGDFSHQAFGNNNFKTKDNTPERMPTILDMASRPSPLEIDGSGELEKLNADHVEKLLTASPEKSPENSNVIGNPNDDANLLQVSSLLQQRDEDGIEKRGHFETVENHEGSSRSTLDGTKLESFTDRNPSRSLVSVSVQMTDQSEGRDSLSKSPIHNADTDPAAAKAKIEQMLISPKSSPPAGIAKVSPKEEGIENIPTTTSETVSLRDVEDEERKPKIEDEIQSAPCKKATRRGRSQTRYSTKPLENSDPPSSSNSFVSRKKGRGRRVTWAGSLVGHLRQQSTDQQGPQSPQQGIEALDEDVLDSSLEAADSFGQEQDVDDWKEGAPKPENGSRKRNSEALEISSRYNDLDKIKRRFNMSDAAVARLLGTDEEEDLEDLEDPDLISGEATGVKVRSLSHFHPEADGNGDESTVPNFRRVSKGLRSVRSRSEEGARRPWPFTSGDQGKFNGEELVSPYDHTAATAGNMNGSFTGDGHPSDNEFMNGRRRMRSIADVSFSNLPQNTRGRPPLARGLRCKRGRHVVLSPLEALTDPSDDDLPPTVPPPSISLSPGKFRGKGGPRSARKRKEPEPDPLSYTSDVSMSPNSSRETSPSSFKRRKRTGAISVLHSHGLNEDTIKHQKKIVAKLGGRVSTSASECSHFVADKFVRTGNMLEAMASGKPVVNIGWLETCSEANRFVDEEEFILQDAKKEEEMGFFMMSTLAAARQRPLLQGIRVYMTPGTLPGPDSLARIVTSAGGQVVDEYYGPAADGTQESNFCLVISSEEEYEDCIPLMEQGAKVYTPELILSGVTSYHLDFSNDQLFKNFTIRRRRGSLSRRTV